MTRIYIIGSFLLLSVINPYAQDIANKDSLFSIEMEGIQSAASDMSIDKMQYEMQSTLVQPAFPAIMLQKKKDKSILFITPYSYSLDSFLEGITIKGFYGRYFLTNFLEADLNIFVSKTFFGKTAPASYYLNGSLRAELVFKLHDRVQLTGMGQLSMREGLDPKNPSLMGGANCYGAGIRFKITGNVGVGIGFTNNYYRGGWTKRTYIAPVGF
jgi:hypothetical protein